MFTNVCLGGLGVFEVGVGGCVGTACVADLFGEAFRGFQSGGSSGGAEGQNACGAQHVGHTCGEGSFGANDDETDALVSTKINDCVPVFGVDVYAICDLGDASIARCAEQLVTFRILGDGPCKRVFATASTEN